MALPGSRVAAIAWAMTVGGGVIAGAQPLAWPAPVDPLRATSCPAAPWQLSAVPAGAWRVAFSAGYFNLWSGTWHTGTIHRALGRLGEPMQPDELRLIEQEFPHDAVHRLDLEGWGAELVVARGLGSGFVLAARLPWLQIGAPNWDAIPQSFHSAVGISQARRRWFPRGASVIYVHDGDRTLERLGDLDGSGPGDMAVSLSGPAGAWLGGEQRWGVVVEAPTGRRGTLRGSGGWDRGVRWRSAWTGKAWQAGFEGGYSWLDGAGSFLGVRRSDTWNGAADVAARLGAATWGRFRVAVEASPLSSFTSGLPGEPALTFVLALARRTFAGSWAFVELGENVSSVGAAPDFSVTLGWSVTPPATRSLPPEGRSGR